VGFAAVDFRIVAPNLFARRGIQRDDYGASGWQVEPAFNQYWVGLKCKRFPVAFPEFTSTVTPYFLERFNVVTRNLG
jgi:hypothetical protein